MIPFARNEKLMLDTDIVDVVILIGERGLVASMLPNSAV
jgi:hypothetical protein